MKVAFFLRALHIRSYFNDQVFIIYLSHGPFVLQGYTTNISSLSLTQYFLRGSYLIIYTGSRL